MSSSCWRCGAQTPEGVIECPTHNTTQFTYSGPEVWKSIDWNKVENLEDMKRIFAALHLRVRVGGAEWEAIRDLLED